MRQALIKYNNIEAGLLTETDQGEYLFEYSKSYIQEYPNQFLTFQMPVSKQVYRSNREILLVNNHPTLYKISIWVQWND